MQFVSNLLFIKRRIHVFNSAIRVGRAHRILIPISQPRLKQIPQSLKWQTASCPAWNASECAQLTVGELSRVEMPPNVLLDLQGGEVQYSKAFGHSCRAVAWTDAKILCGIKGTDCRRAVHSLRPAGLPHPAATLWGAERSVRGRTRLPAISGCPRQLPTNGRGRAVAEGATSRGGGEYSAVRIRIQRGPHTPPEGWTPGGCPASSLPARPAGRRQLPSNDTHGPASRLSPPPAPGHRGGIPGAPPRRAPRCGPQPRGTVWRGPAPGGGSPPRRVPRPSVGSHPPHITSVGGNVYRSDR